MLRAVSDVTNKPDSKAVREFHTNADTDGSPKAIHHTLGSGANQAAPGNHSHDGGQSVILDPPDPVVIDYSWTALPLSNAWAVFGAGFEVPSYRKIGDEVQVRGLMKHAITTTAGVFATLPLGFRPLAIQQFPGNASGGIADLRVASTGALSIQSYLSGNGASLSLSLIRFSVN